METISQKISCSPVTTCFMFDMKFLCVQVSNKKGKYLLHGLNTSLQPIWGLNCDFLRVVSRDRQSRTVPPKEFDLEIECAAAKAKQGMTDVI